VPPGRCRRRCAHEAFLAELRAAPRGSGSTDDDASRLVHSHGQLSVDEIYRLLGGAVPERLVDLVAHPRSEAEVHALVRLADRTAWCSIPYGGGTNVSGALACPPDERRMIVSVDMRQMNRVLEIDRANGWVVVEAGITGKDLEARLEAEGLTTGHVPDSVELSTVGGWIATNASGMKKNRYGNIEEVVLDAVLVTPRGEVRATPVVPRSATGIAAQRLAFGSEGGLGIVTRAVLHVWPLPDVRRYASFVFPDFEAGVRYLQAVQAAGVRPPASASPTTPSSAWGRRWVARRRAWRADVEAHEALRHAREGLRPGAHGGLHRGDGGLGGRGPAAGAQPVRPAEGARRTVGRPRERPPRLRRHLRDRLHPRLPQHARHLRRDVRDLGPVEPHPRHHRRRRGGAASHVRGAGRGGHALPVVPALAELPRRRVHLLHDGLLRARPRGPGPTFHEIEHRMREVVLEQGGSLSHHHGVGKIRQDFVPRVHSEASIRAVRALKRSLDPNDVFGAGNHAFTASVAPLDEGEPVPPRVQARPAADGPA
jgi:alkyldihydroxyacetonephosphate synthase